MKTALFLYNTGEREMKISSARKDLAQRKSAQKMKIVPQDLNAIQMVNFAEVGAMPFILRVVHKLRLYQGAFKNYVDKIS